MLKDCGSTEYWWMTRQFCIPYVTNKSLNEQTCYDLTTSTGIAVLDNMTDISFTYRNYYFSRMNINRVYWRFSPSSLETDTSIE